MYGGIILFDQDIIVHPDGFCCLMLDDDDDARRMSDMFDDRCIVDRCFPSSLCDKSRIMVIANERDALHDASDSRSSEEYDRVMIMSMIMDDAIV